MLTWIAAASLLGEPSARAADAEVGAKQAGAASRPATGSKPARRSEPTSQKVVVRGRSGVDRVRRALSQIPGGTSVIDQKTVTRSRVLTDQDVLAYQPGVYAQSSGGADGLKISIRGSGVDTGTNYFRQGIYITFDGLPVTGPGGTPYELFEPLGLQYTEVLRGANAFDAGSVDLGGAINYVTNTGYTALPALARYEFGSFGYQKEQLSSGMVVGPWDYYISFTNSYRSGYQDHTRATSTGVAVNLGYQINPNITTRFYFRYRQTEDQYPGDLTTVQIRQNPRQSYAPYNQIGFNATRVQPGSEWVGNKTTIRIDDQSRVVIGEDWHNYPIDIRQGPQEGVWGYEDFTGSVLYSRNDVVAGRDTDTTAGFFSTTHLNGFQNVLSRVPAYVSPPLPPLGTLLERQTFQGSDNDFHFSNNTNVWRNLWLDVGGALIVNGRGVDFPVPVTDTPSYRLNSANFAPRFGLQYKFTPDTRVYANVDRSVEPPNDWEFAGGNIPTSGPLQGYATSAVKLRDETAWTAEIGTAGTWRGETWQADYYHSNVRNELLSISTLQNIGTGLATYSNASPTIHQGVEATLTSMLWRTRAWVVSLRQSYTFSHFNFNDDSVLGHNQLPGIPMHFYQGELRCDWTDGFYASVNAQAASSMPVDYADTVHSAPYHIFGATFGYDDDRNGREVFVSFDNLADTHYAPIVEPTYNCGGNPNACPFLQPGDGFGVFAGVQFGYR